MVIMISGMVLLSSSLVVLTHPLALAGALIAYAIITSGAVGYIAFSWLMYMLVLIFLGGVMVLVVYMTTLAANEKFIMLENYGVLLVLGVVVGLGSQKMLPLLAAPVGMAPSSNVVTVMFESSSTTLYLFSVLYLLLALVCVVKVIKLEKGPLVMRA